MINTECILDFFNISYFWEDNVPKILLKLKQSKRIRKDCPIKAHQKNGKIVCATGKEYYAHYLGEELGYNVFLERKKLYSKNTIVMWYIENFNPPDKDKLLLYLDKVSKKRSDSINAFYTIPSKTLDDVKLAYKERSAKWSKKIGKQNADRWNNPEWVLWVKTRNEELGANERRSESCKKTYANPIFKSKFVEIANGKSRIEKISKSSKETWARWKEHDIKMYRYMIESLKSKNYTHGNMKMNSIEYVIANVLDSIGCEWEFEKVIHFDNISYIPDFTLDKEKIIVECYGDYWHANPEFHTPNKILFEGHTVQEKWNYDLAKKEAFEKNGYHFLYFWECDIKSNINKITEDIKNAIHRRRNNTSQIL